MQLVKNSNALESKHYFISATVLCSERKKLILSLGFKLGTRIALSFNVPDVEIVFILFS